MFQNAPSRFVCHHDGGSIGIGRSNIGENRCVYDPKTLYPEDLKIGIDYRTLNIRSHTAGSTGMVNRR